MKKLLLTLSLIIGITTVSFGQSHPLSSTIMKYTSAIKSNPNDADAYYQRGAIYVKLKEYTSAISDFTSTIRIKPNLANPYYSRGITYSLLKEYRYAISDYTSAIRLDPDNAKAYFNRGQAYFELEEYHYAISDYTSLIRLDPDFAIAYKNRGAAKNRTGFPSNGWKIPPCSDYKKACDLGDDGSCEWYYNQCR